MIDERQRRLMEVARAGESRASTDLAAAGWATDKKEIRSCGDTVSLFLDIQGEQIRAARYDAAGCVLALSSAELLCRYLSGTPVSEARTVLSNCRDYLAGSVETNPLPPELEDLSLVREYPARKRCVLLAFEVALAVL